MIAHETPKVQVQEQILEVVKVLPQERFSKRFGEQIVVIPVPQIVKEIVEVV